MSYAINVHSRSSGHNGTSVSRIPPGANTSEGLADAGPGYLNTAPGKLTLVILDKRTLDRECFAQCLRSYGIGMEIQAFASLRDWHGEEDLHPPLAVLLHNIGGRRMSDPATLAELRDLATGCPGIPVIVMADNDDLDQVLLALENGARGYIPTSVGIGVCAEAIALALAGGTFVPASSVVAMRDVIGSSSPSVRPMSGMFTQRQEEVARALRKGKANKIIAYELNLRESTVKVHIRNIMKKLKATNRTEVAYKISQIIAE